MRSILAAAAAIGLVFAAGAPVIAADNDTRMDSSQQSGTPQGFNQGNANFKGETGEPPGWDQGSKKGWNCTETATTECKPPGLRNK